MISTNVYLAAGYDQQERMRGYRKTLEDRRDLVVTSRWIDVKESNPMQEQAISADEESAANYCRVDLDDHREHGRVPHAVWPRHRSSVIADTMSTSVRSRSSRGRRGRA